MRTLLTILLVLSVGTVSAQSACYLFWPGEYQNGLDDTCNHRFGTAAIGGAVGNSSPGTNGKPGLLTPGQITGGGVMDTVSAGASCLHSQLAIKKGLLYGTGINDNHSFGLGPAAGNQSQFTLVTQDSMGHAFTNVVGVFSFANSYGSGTLAWKGGSQGDTLWAAGLLEGGMRGNGSNPTTDNGYFVPITGFDAGDTIIDAKADAILIVLTKNGTGVRKVYTSGNNSAWTGNGTSDLTLHKLSLSFTPMLIDLGVFWAHIIGTDGKDHAWGWYQQIWGGTLSSSPTTPTDITSNIGMTGLSIAAFSQGDISSYYITTTGKMYGLGNDICSGLGVLPKISWNSYSTNNPLYGTPKTPWAWNQNQLEAPPLWRVTQATLLDSCNTYIAVTAGHTFGAYVMAEDVNHIIHSQGRNKGGPQANGTYDQQYVNGNPEGQYPNSYDSASRDHQGWFMDFPWNDVGGTARHAPYCDTVPTATFCNLYTPENESPPVISGFNNVTSSGPTYTYSGITITGQGGHSVHNIRMTERTTSGCPTSSNSTPYNATTTFSGLSVGVHTIQLIATDDQYKQTVATATLTVSGGSQTVFYFSAAGSGTACTFASPCAGSYFNTIFPSAVGGNAYYFNRGDAFAVELVAGVSGSAGNPIIIGAYGTGPDPIIGGTTLLSGWTNTSGNLWQTNWAGPYPQLLSINGVLASKGRSPNLTTGYFIPSAMGTNTVTDAVNASQAPIGDTIIGRSSGFTLDQVKVTGNASNILTVSPNFTYTGANGLGWFVWNTPDSATEWNNLAGKIQVYSVGSPAGYKVPAVGIPLTISGNYINVSGLHVKGGDTTCILLTGSNDNIIGDSITFGYDGIEITSAVSDTISGNYIAHMGDNAILKTNTSNYNNIITNNFIYDIGMLPGMGRTSNTFQSYCGILAGDSGCVVKFNTLDSIGYIGVANYGSGLVDDSNFVINYCFVKADGAAHYTWKPSAGTLGRRGEMKGNISVNGGGPMALNGTTLNNSALASAIYLDNYSSQIDVSYNTAYNINGPAFFDHGPSNSFTYNTAYLSGYCDFLAAEVGPVITNLSVNHNNFGSATSTLPAVRFSTINNDLSTFGAVDNNNIAGAIGTTLPFWTFSTGASDPGTFRTLAGWTSNTGYDAHSTFQTGALSLQYSVPGATIQLGGNFKDLIGNIYPGILNLNPYSSSLLIQLPCSCVNISYFPKIL